MWPQLTFEMRCCCIPNRIVKRIVLNLALDGNANWRTGCVSTTLIAGLVPHYAYVLCVRLSSVTRRRLLMIDPAVSRCCEPTSGHRAHFLITPIISTCFVYPYERWWTGVTDVKTTCRISSRYVTLPVSCRRRRRLTPLVYYYSFFGSFFFFSLELISFLHSTRLSCMWRALLASRGF